jgi:polyisoprenoid-binding protein YceI
MRNFLLTAAALLSMSAFAYADMTPIADMPAGEYKLDPTHASVTWKVNHMGLSNYAARFTKMDATITLDPKDLSKSKLVATVDPASVRTDYPDVAKKDFDKELTSAEWFNTAKFPEAKFESTKIETTGKNTGKIHGNLTFLGVTKPLTFDVTFNGGYEKHPMANIPALGFSATATMKRTEWGFKNMVPHIADDVTLHIEAEFVMAKK